MHRLVGCYIKKKIGKCPYEMLIQIEDEIEHLKKAREYLKKQYAELIDQVEQMKLLNFNYKRTLYLDGFSWGSNQENLEGFTYLKHFTQETREYREICSFGNQDCELQLLARKSMKNFLINKLMMELQSYNNVLNVYESIIYYHQKVDSSSFVFIRFLIEGDSSKAFYYSVNLNRSFDNDVSSIMFFEKERQDKECQKHKLYIKTESDFSVLANTCVLHLGKNPVLIQLCGLISWVEEGAQFKLKSLYELLSEMTGTKSMTISLYGKLEELSIEEKIACITYFKKEGFRILGAFKENSEFEDECFVYRLIKV